MSSTTDGRSERGQILVIFAASLLVIFGIAALVFDGGLMLLEKRDQQNAADAAAIAGARFLPNDHGAAWEEAIEVARINGFEDGVADQVVTVTFPSAERIRVEIEDATPSFFAGIWGIFSHDVASKAVAINGTRPVGPFGILTLNETACPSMEIGGNGAILSAGDIQVNSGCASRAWWMRGQGEVVVADGVRCTAVGTFRQDGASSLEGCEVVGGPAIPDPFLSLDPYEPPIPVDGSGVVVYPTPPIQESGGALDIPAGCPGSTAPATDVDPELCRFTAVYSGTTWRLFPGFYPGGIHLLGGTFYLEPGIYYVAGGGITMNGVDATIRSVDTLGTAVGGGVLLYNGDHPTEPDGGIRLNGGGSGIDLLPLETGTWAGISVYQDAQICLDVVLNGDSGTMTVAGTIYVPCGTVSALGNGGTVITDQIVADKFKLSGNIGSLQVRFDSSFLPGVRLAGLIE